MSGEPRKKQTLRYLKYLVVILVNAFFLYNIFRILSDNAIDTSKGVMIFMLVLLTIGYNFYAVYISMLVGLINFFRNKDLLTVLFIFLPVILIVAFKGVRIVC